VGAAQQVVNPRGRKPLILEDQQAVAQSRQMFLGLFDKEIEVFPRFT